MYFFILAFCVLSAFFATIVSSASLEKVLFKRFAIEVHPATHNPSPSSTTNQMRLYHLIHKVYEEQLIASWLVAAALWLSFPGEWESVFVVAPGAVCAGLVIAPASLFLAKYSFRTFVRMCTIPPPKNSSVR